MANEDVTQGARKHFNLRITDEELARIERLQERLQTRIANRAGVSVRVSQKMVFFEALDALERDLDEKERKR